MEGSFAMQNIYRIESDAHINAKKRNISTIRKRSHVSACDSQMIFRMEFKIIAENSMHIACINGNCVGSCVILFFYFFFASFFFQSLIYDFV